MEVRYMSNNIRPGEVETKVSDAPTTANNSRRAFLVRTGWATAAMLALGSIGVAKATRRSRG